MQPVALASRTTIDQASEWQSPETHLTARSRIQAVLATDEHAGAIATFYREAWGQTTTAESVSSARRQAAAENVVAPGEAPPIAIVLEGGRVIGYCGSIPQRLWDGVAEHPAYWVKGLMVLPEYQGGPIGFLVVKELAKHVPRATNLVVAPAARRLFGALGWTDLGAVANYVRPLRAARAARRLDVAGLGLGLPRWVTAGMRVAQRTGLAGLAGVAGVAFDLVATATRRAAARFTTRCALDMPDRDELDDVWRAARGGLAAGPVRDGTYLRSRFGVTSSEASDAPYTFVTARDGARLVGAAVVRRPKATTDPRLRGIRVATVSDILFPPERADIGLAVLHGVEQAARAAGGDAILCTTSHRALARLLRRQAYVRLPGNVHFLLRDATAAPRWPRDLQAWWLARGDGDADEVF
jgi:hypothetical protein